MKNMCLNEIGLHAQYVFIHSRFNSHITWRGGGGRVGEGAIHEKYLSNTCLSMPFLDGSTSNHIPLKYRYPNILLY